DLRNYGFSSGDRPILEALKQGATLRELELLHGDPRTAQTIVYTLASCGVISFTQITLPRAPTQNEPTMSRVPTPRSPTVGGHTPVARSSRQVDVESEPAGFELEQQVTVPRARGTAD